MLWAYVCRLDVLTSKKGAPRVTLRVPLGSKTRAQALQFRLDCGRIRGGSIEFEGHDLLVGFRAVLPRVDDRLESLLGELVQAAEVFVRTLDSRGGRGYALTEEQRAEQNRAAERIVRSWEEAVREVMRP